jgi:hypothetical protein
VTARNSELVAPCHDAAFGIYYSLGDITKIAASVCRSTKNCLMNNE